MSLEAILSRIAKGETIPPAELLPYLCLERREQRVTVNLLLARAHFKRGGPENLQLAREFISRAWLLSRYSPLLLNRYVQIHAAVDDIESVRDAYKRVGIDMASQGKIGEALGYFDQWQYAYWQFKHLDRYEYDEDVLQAVDRLAEPHRFSQRLRDDVLSKKPIRVAYLVKGIRELSCSVVRINLLFAKFHDRKRVEPIFFVPESEQAVRSSAAGREHLELFEDLNCKVIMAPDVKRWEDQLIGLAGKIYEAGPDILVPSAALGEFQHCFITALKPAPLIVGLIQGPPEQFAIPTFDWGIAWSRHPMLDSPVSASHIEMQFELPSRSEIEPLNKREFDIPKDAPVIGSGGRHAKFQEPEFWRAMAELLDTYPRLYFLAMGVEESQVPGFQNIVPEHLRKRIRFVKWRSDYLRVMILLDVVIDTFPSGGGSVLCDAMALGIPVVSFRNNYFKRYDQNDWTPAEEFVIPDVIVERGNFAQMKRLVSKLLDDPAYRSDITRRLQEHVKDQLSDPSQPVHQCEDLYFRLLEQKVSGVAAKQPREEEMEAISRRLAREQTVKGWIVKTKQKVDKALRSFKT